jgi:hypothetical protein
VAHIQIGLQAVLCLKRGQKTALLAVAGPLRGTATPKYLVFEHFLAAFRYETGLQTNAAGRMQLLI